MKIKVTDLASPMTIALKGDESWLAPIYDSFSTGPSTQALSGQLHLSRDIAGFVRIEGSIQFTPFVECSRCADAIPWPISESVSAVFRPTPDARIPHKENILSREELDHYFIQDGAVDLLEFLNESVQMSLPLQTVRADASNDACSICGVDLTVSQVYGDPEDADSRAASPFSVLGSMH